MKLASYSLDANVTLLGFHAIMKVTGSGLASSLFSAVIIKFSIFERMLSGLLGTQLIR